MVPRRVLVSLALGLASCRHAAASADAAASPPVAAAPGAAPSPDGQQELAPADRAILERGVAAIEAGDFENARLIFAGMLDRYPGHPDLVRLHARASAEVDREEKRRAAMRPRAVEAVAFRRLALRRAPVQQGRAPELVQVSKQRNEITDTDAWFRDNGLRLPTWTAPNPRMNEPGDVPPWIPAQFEGQKLVRAIDDERHAIAIYGEEYSRARLLFVFDEQRELVGAYDFLAWVGTSEPGGPALTDRHIIWAIVRDGVLFVASAHFGYAKESGGRTAFITALDLGSGEVSWRSRPLVANAQNFIYEDGYLITGYGFTAEPDFLFVLDAATGEMVTRTRLRTGPTYILEKDRRIFVRTYDTDYVFDIR